MTRDVRRDLGVIRDELHCTAVLLYGAHIGRLRVAAITARELGLEVWFQPRLPDHSRGKVLEHLGRAAAAAETVRAEHGGVTFVAGCEHSLFTNGLIPGPHTFVRLKLLRFLPRLQPRVTRKLDALLERGGDARAPGVPRAADLRRRVLGARRLVALRPSWA